MANNIVGMLCGAYLAVWVLGQAEAPGLAYFAGAYLGALAGQLLVRARPVWALASSRTCPACRSQIHNQATICCYCHTPQK